MSGQFNIPDKPQFRKGADGRTEVYDHLRRKWLLLTPEENVRQHFVTYLIKAKNFRPSFIANEIGLKLNGMSRRVDTLIYKPDLTPLCIVEYKRPDVSLDAKVFGQIARYNSVLGTPYLIVTNGLKLYCCRFDGDSYTFLSTLPTYDEMLES